MPGAGPSRAADAAAAASGGGGAGGTAAAATNASQQQQQPPPLQLGSNLLLEFRDAGLEAAYQHDLHGAQRAADVCIVAVNAAVLAMVLLQQHAGGAGGGGAGGGNDVAAGACSSSDSSNGECAASSASSPSSSWSLPAPARVLCALVALQSAMLLALLLRAPAAYARWRAPLVCATRLYRLVAWAAHVPSARALALAAGGTTAATAAAAAVACAGPAPLCESLSARLFLLSPAAASVLFALLYPLPLRAHLWLQALTAGAAVARGAALLVALGAQQPALAAQAAAAHDRLTRITRLLELPTQRLVPGRGARPPLSLEDSLWCLYAFVTLVYGLLLPAVCTYVKEVYLRVRFLSRLQPAIAPPQLAAARAALYSTTLAAAFLAISLAPCLWGLLQLAPAYVWRSADAGGGAGGGGGGPRADGIALLATLLALEVFMRFWLLSVFSLAFNFVLRPLAGLLLLRRAARGGGGGGARRGGGVASTSAGARGS